MIIAIKTHEITADTVKTKNNAPIDLMMHSENKNGTKILQWHNEREAKTFLVFNWNHNSQSTWTREEKNGLKCISFCWFKMLDYHNILKWFYVHFFVEFILALDLTRFDRRSLSSLFKNGKSCTSSRKIFEERNKLRKKDILKSRHIWFFPLKLTINVKDFRWCSTSTHTHTHFSFYFSSFHFHLSNHWISREKKKDWRNFFVASFLLAIWFVT